MPVGQPCSIRDYPLEGTNPIVAATTFLGDDYPLKVCDPHNRDICDFMEDRYRDWT